MPRPNGKQIQPTLPLLSYLFHRITIRSDCTYQGIPCWIWNLKVDTSNGYTHATWQKTRYYTHRLFYQVFVGEIPQELHIDHLCRNRQCCNPTHLELVTPKENTLRGESPSAKQARQTHCENGHPFTDYRTSQGKRRCVTCNRLWWKKLFHSLMQLPKDDPRYIKYREEANRRQQSRRARLRDAAQH